MPPESRAGQGRARHTVPAALTLASLRLRENRLRALLEHCTTTVLIVDPDARVLLQAGSPGTPLGRSDEEIGADAFAFVTPADRPRARQALGECRARPEQPVSTTVRVCRDGTLHTVVITLRNLCHRPDVQGIVLNMHDATGEADALEALRESEARFHAVFDNAAVGIALRDRQGRLLQANPAFLRMLGYTADELRGTADREISHPADIPLARAQMDAVLSGLERASAVERRYVRKDGQIVHAYVTASAIAGAEGRPTTCITVADDITDRKAAEHRYRQILEAIPQMVWMLGRDTRITWCNENYIRYLGAPGEAAGRERWVASVHPEDRATALNARRQALAAGSMCAVELRLRRASDGAYRWFLNRAAPIRDDEGRITHLLGTSTDIDDEKRAREAANRLAAIVETSPDAIVRLDVDGRIASWNAGATGLLGYVAGEVAGVSAAGILAARRPTEYQECVARIREGEQAFHIETVGLTKDGREVSLAVTVSAIRDASGTLLGLSVIARDITTRVQAEAALQRYRLLADSATDMIAFIGPDGGILEVNEALLRASGYTRDELCGHTTAYLRAPGAVAGYGPPPPGEASARYETISRRKDGETFPVEVTVQPMQTNGEVVTVAVGRDISERREHEEERTRLIRRLVTVQEEERRRLARELHDEIGQYVTAMSLGLRALAPAVAGSKAARARLDTLIDITKRISVDIHRMAWELRPAILDDMGLESALRAYAREWSHGTGVPVDIHARGLTAVLLPSDLEMTVYRVVQEALTNVAKHARAHRAGLLLNAGEGALQLIVEDDGCGFAEADEAKGIASRRFGLIGMRERLRLVGGSLEIESSRGRGTTLYARMPLVRPRKGADRDAD